MMSRNATTCLLTGFLILSIVPAGGCSGEEPQPQVTARAAPPPPPPPPAPTVKSVADLMQELNIDPRITLAEEHAPPTTEARIALLTFFDGFVRGDQQVVSAMLSPIDRPELDHLVRSGAWAETAKNITEAWIQSGKTEFGDAVIARFDVGNTFQPQFWYYTVNGEEATFEAAPTPPGIIDQLAGNWLEAWERINKNELLLAEKPDLEFEAPSQPTATDAGSSGSPESTEQIEDDGDVKRPGFRMTPPTGRGGRNIPKAPRRAPGFRP
jgi:hypothetical protein